MTRLAVAVAVVLSLPQFADAAQIRGQYIEARSCDVYTGPCFANAEMELSGKEAVMAWKVEQGGWNGQNLEGLCVAVILKSFRTLGDDGVFARIPGPISSVVLVDERANPDQHDALVAFVREAASEYLADVKKIVTVAMNLKTDHATGRGEFEAGRLAEIRTRGLEDFDCVCTNEKIFYKPLTEVQNYMPAYSLTQSYQGQGLGSRWTVNNSRSSFLATFKR